MMDEWITRLRESRFFVPFMILVASGIISVALFLSAPEPETREVVAPVILVDAFRVNKSSLTMTVETQGEVLARTRTTLVSEVSGVITDLADSFVAGGYFSKGDLLIKIDGRNYTSEVARARANISSGKRKLAEEEGLGKLGGHYGAERACQTTTAD